MSRREPPISEKLAVIVAEIRQAGMSSSEIIRQTGLSRSTLWRYENGEGKSPDYSTVRRLEGLRDQLKR